MTTEDDSNKAQQQHGISLEEVNRAISGDSCVHRAWTREVLVPSELLAQTRVMTIYDPRSTGPCTSTKLP